MVPDYKSLKVITNIWSKIPRCFLFTEEFASQIPSQTNRIMCNVHTLAKCGVDDGSNEIRTRSVRDGKTRGIFVLHRGGNPWRRPPGTTVALARAIEVPLSSETSY